MLTHCYEKGPKPIKHPYKISPRSIQISVYLQLQRSRVKCIWAYKGVKRPHIDELIRPSIINTFRAIYIETYADVGISQARKIITGTIQTNQKNIIKCLQIATKRVPKWLKSIQNHSKIDPRAFLEQLLRTVSKKVRNNDLQGYSFGVPFGPKGRKGEIKKKRKTSRISVRENLSSDAQSFQNGIKKCSKSMEDKNMMKMRHILKQIITHEASETQKTMFFLRKNNMFAISTKDTLNWLNLKTFKNITQKSSRKH